MRLTIYRIFSFLLLPVAILFSIAVLLLIGAAFANPPLFFSIFFAAGVSIYTFASLNFLIRGIDGNKFLGRSSKDWFIVNALVSVIYALLAIAQQFILLLHPEIIETLANSAKMNAGSSLSLSGEQLTQSIKGISYFIFIYGIVLFVHIIFSFYYLKKYGYLFQNEKNQ